MVEKMENVDTCFASRNTGRSGIDGRVTSGDALFETGHWGGNPTVGGQQQERRWEEDSDMATGRISQSDICRVKGELGLSTLRGTKADLTP